MRICTDCKQELPDEVFDYRGGGRKGLQATCKPCCLERLRKHRIEMRSIVNRWKEMKGCSCCGFKGKHYQLDLDHVDRTTKTNYLNHRAYEPAWSKKKIKEEIKKCVILCKNCHAEKTFRDKDYLPL